MCPAYTNIALPKIYDLIFLTTSWWSVLLSSPFFQLSKVGQREVKVHVQDHKTQAGSRPTLTQESETLPFHIPYGGRGLSRLLCSSLCCKLSLRTWCTFSIFSNFVPCKPFGGSAKDILETTHQEKESFFPRALKYLKNCSAIECNYGPQVEKANTVHGISRKGPYEIQIKFWVKNMGEKSRN